MMHWDIDISIGKIHRFWWWCVDYAEDGDLRRHNDMRIGNAVGLNGEHSQLFVESMCKAGFIDREPYFRVHDWWDYFGKFLQVKYKHSPEKWQKIKDLYDEEENRSKNRSRGSSKNPKDKIYKIDKITKDIYSPETIMGIISDLNEVFGTNYKTDPVSKDIQDLILARLKENYSIEDFKKVHRNKYQSWGNDPKMQKYLRPQTLYTSKFSAYLNEQTNLSDQGKVSPMLEKRKDVFKRFEEDNAQ